MTHGGEGPPPFPPRHREVAFEKSIDYNLHHVPTVGIGQHPEGEVQAYNLIPTSLRYFFPLAMLFVCILLYGFFKILYALFKEWENIFTTARVGKVHFFLKEFPFICILRS